MDNSKKYIKIYTEKTEEYFKSFGYYSPPRDIKEFEDWNSYIFQEHLNNYSNEIKKTKLYVSLLDDMYEFGFYMAFKNLTYDYEILNNVLYQTSRQNLLKTGMTASGTDHCNAFMDALAAFACNDFEIIDYFFSKELPLSKGKYYTEISVDLIKVLYFKDNNLLSESVNRGEKFLNKKNTLWEKHTVSYFLSLINRNVSQASFDLQELCTAYQKIGYPKSKLDKCFASEIHGLYRFAKVIDEDFFKKIKRPNHPSFFEKFEIWQEKLDYPKGKIFYTYPKEMDYMNSIFEAQLPTVTLIKEKYAHGVETFKDVEKFALDLTENVKNISV